MVLFRGSCAGGRELAFGGLWRTCALDFLAPASQSVSPTQEVMREGRARVTAPAAEVVYVPACLQLSVCLTLCGIVGILDLGA